jgi:hypothetical protein
MQLIRPVAAGLLLCLAMAAPSALPGQAAPSPAAQPAAEALRVFLDCNTFCDFDHLRREITYVNWVRDRQDADVHLLITSQRTGGGGQEYVLKYIGLRSFRGTEHEVKFTTRQSDTDDEIRNQQTQRIGLGLAFYVAAGSLADRVRLTYTALAADSAAPTQAPRDPWNFWVFRVSANAYFSGESQSKRNNISASLGADRVTERWKFRASVNANRSHSSFQLSDSSTFSSTTKSYNLNSILVRSLGDHWSLGVQGSGSRSTRNNYDLQASLSPGIEYNIFPYKESSRRQLVLIYALGLSYSNYRDTTIFDKLKETRPTQNFTVAAEATQPWGSLFAQLRASNYLDDFSKNRFSVDAYCSVRLVRGLNLNVNGGYSRVHDQLSLLKAGLSDEEILLQLKQLKTSYYYYSSVGLSYTFGSKFNNVVNPRFNNSGGGGGNCVCEGGSCFCF